MQFTQKQGIIIFGAVVVVLLVGFLVYLGIRPASSGLQKITLTMWGTDPGTIFTQDFPAAYKTASNVELTVSYTQINPADYDRKLLNAFAAGAGPDLFEIGNRDLPKWASVVTPIPTALATTFNITTLQNDFPQVVAQDFVANNSVYALPLDLDTMVMLYNKDLFDAASIVYPPKTWNDFETDVTQLRQINAQGQLTQAGAAIGGSETSITNASDLVFLLMMQNGAQMVSSDNSTAEFNNGGTKTGNGQNPGLAAFNFYLQFANSASPYYTWNDGMGTDVQNFIAGKAAIMFGYQSDISQIKAKAPFLNFGIAPMPQPASSSVAVNYAKYEGLAVSRQSAQAAAAWQFIIFAASNPNGEAVYTKDTGEPPASRAYIAANINDPNYGVFASQALTARSWYQTDPTAIDGIMNTAIQNVLNGSMNSTQALGAAQDAVTGVMQNR